jgi:hypothetical protein
MGDRKECYLGFLFTRTSVKLHVTHCYFGELSESEAEFVSTMVDVFFKHHGPIAMKPVTFNVPAMFGPNWDMRVLLTNDIREFRAMQGLRDFFVQNEFIQPHYPFRPHIATDNLTDVDAPFCSYALVCNKVVLKEWDIRGQKFAARESGGAKDE